MSNESTERFSRRAYLKHATLAGTIAATGLAGCTSGSNSGSSNNGSGGGGDGGSNNGNSSGSGGQNALELVHWWTAGGEKQALNALLDGFKKKHPEVKIKNNPAPGGAGSALAAAIKSRVLSDNPPSTFQIWPGEALSPYIESDVLDDISDSVWTKEMQKAYLPGPRKLAKPSGNFVAVPLDIHRLNNLFYNVQVLKDAGIDPKSIENPSDLLSAMKTVEKKTDAVGLAQATSQPWTTLQLWGTVFLSQVGAKTFMDFIAGNPEKYEKEIKEALTLLTKYKQHWNKDSASLTWDQANTKLINGKAAFFHQGDWAAGQYEATKGFEYKKDWNQVTFPGSSGIYSLVIDSFVMPKNNPSPEATKKWLSYCGSIDGQKRFNPIKGSIPPRADVPMDSFGPFLKNQFDDFTSSNVQTPTIAHGLAVEPEIHSSMDEAFAAFSENWNVEEAYNGIVNAFDV
ncbi:MAG TPA: extracellular solute-binding protein [Halococcus sp.]|nr:extracellular solute-binding protein [Halococcus sp.]